MYPYVIHEVEIMSKFSETVFEKIVSCNDFEDIYRERRIHGAKRELRTHFGPDTTITAFKAILTCTGNI